MVAKVDFLPLGDLRKGRITNESIVAGWRGKEHIFLFTSSKEKGQQGWGL